MRKVRISDLADIIVSEMKLTRNDIVMVHASIQDVYIIDSKPEDLIYFLKMIVGTQGALLMPVSVYKTNNVKHNERSHHVSNLLYSDNPLNEIFRQMTDTNQINLSDELYYWWGKIPKSITENNFMSSPEYSNNNSLCNLSRMKAKIIGIGTPYAKLSLFNTNYNSILISQDRILRQISKDQIRLFRRRGIHFFCVDAEKAFSGILSNERNEIDIENEPNNCLT